MAWPHWDRWSVNTQQPVCVKHEHMPTHTLRTLTKTLDEADDTCPAPFSWHFHGVNSQTNMESGMESNVGSW